MAEHDLKLLSISSDLPVPRLEPASNDVQEPSALELLLASALLASQSKALSASPEPSSVQIAELKKLCRGEAPSLVASGLCTASLFLKGKAAVFANALTFSLDEWHPFSSKTGIGNYEPVFGAAKGLAIKAIYSRWGAIDALRLLTPTQLDLTTKATLLGFSSRVCSSIFSVSNWQGPQGEIDPSRLIRTTAAAAFSPALICTDLFVSASCKSVEHILERTNTGVLERNAVLSNSFLGAWLGCSTGASAEIQKEMQEKKQLEPGSIFSSACKHAFVNALAVLPAGMQSHFESSRIYQNIKILEDHPDAKIPESRRDFEIGAGCKRPARVPFESCPSHYPCDEQKDLRLPAPPVIPLAELTASLGKSTTTQEDILLQRSGVKGQFTARSLTQLGIDEYLRTTTRVERQRVIVHNPDGLGGEIAVPFEYSKVLDLVRKERLSFESKQFSDLRSSNGNAAQGMEWKALPEDLAKLLREVPNNQLVKRANLYNHHCPHDALFGFEAAATATKGTINFYKRTNNEDLRVTTNHEWSHLLHDANPDLFRLYKSARQTPVIMQEAIIVKIGQCI